MALRARLSATHGHDWRRAQMIMDEITTIMGHKTGPGKGSITPRACATCGYFGHTRQHCKVAAARAARRAAREAEALEEEREEVRREGRQRAARWQAEHPGQPLPLGMDPDHWELMLSYWKARAAWMSERVAGGCRHVVAESAADLPACGGCDRCQAWNALLEQYANEHPPPKPGTERT